LTKERPSGKPFLLIALIILLGLILWIFLFPPVEGWKILRQESKRILGWGGEETLEERRIREEVIYKKMAEASISQDWRAFAPEYPRPRRLESATKEERLKALKSSPEFIELDKELKEYLKKKEELLYPEPPAPSPTEVMDVTQLKDRGAEKAIERLLSSKERDLPEKPLEENLSLGIKGPLVSRKILERPSLPQVKIKVEAEIELTFYVLADGMVDRVVPTVRGDAELERIAIQYLKQWRFAPLPKDQPQVEQWGVIPIKFRLQ
jgi:TonB family protein